MIHPFRPTEPQPCFESDVFYKIVAWQDELPAFDPLPMFKTVLLNLQSVKRFNRFVPAFSPFLGPFIYSGLVLRFATFVSPAPVGRILAPIAAVLQLPAMILTLAHMRTEYVRIIVRTFDFCFLQTANTLWAVTLSAILGDIRIVLVFSCWMNFTCWLLQETYLRNSYFVVGVALCESLFFAMLLPCLLLDFVDDVEHFTLLTADSRTLSTKDILANVIATMAMFSLRNLYRRYNDVRHQTLKPGTAMQALGYRCKIELSVAGPLMKCVENIASPHDGEANGKRLDLASVILKGCKPPHHPPLQMHLAAELARFDSRKTVCPLIGSLRPLSSLQLVGLYACQVFGGGFSLLALFLPKNTYGEKVFAVLGLVMCTLFTGVFVGCCQRQLLKRVVASFHFLFFSFQVIITGIAVVDLFSWRWVPACGVASSLLLGQSLLMIDALTPVMKRRLCFKFWMTVGSIGLLWVVHILLLLDVLVLQNWGLQDRVFLTISLLGRQSNFHVAPFLLSRILTIFVWSAKYAYVVVTRKNDSALILLRGEVEFDYIGWKKQVGFAPRK
ncbi:unnamed protein product [Phytophthora lilii]|uniref:Unnamed protein product n=1 Tax=Phytophthora lilii TaxID=2077276 RepID=A0A9W6U9M1_9STRA|nr:unnamed protein product [Phytophthora lilii]